MTEEVLGFDNPPHIEEWYEVLDNKEYSKVCVAAPRNHAKSTCLSENFPLQEIVRDCNIRILIVSNTQSQAGLHLRTIKARIERDEDYRKYAGQLIPKYPEKWTEKEIIINRTNTDLKDATISTVGMGGAILTRRADLIICDDILSNDNTRTQAQRSKVKKWFYEVLMPVLDPGGRIIFMGTAWHRDDLLNELLEDPTYDFRKKYKAIIGDSNNLELWDEWFRVMYEQSKDKAKEFMKKNKEEMYDGVEVLWPKRFPYKDLYLKRRNNRTAFSKAYQNEVLSEEDQEVKYEWLKYYDELPKDEPFHQGTGVDLAISEKETADYTAMVSGKLIVIDGRPFIYIMPYPVNKRLTFKKTIGKARDISRALGEGSLTDLWVEDVAYQRSAIETMQDAGLPAESIKVSNDKRARLSTVATYIEMGNVLFPRKGSEDLINQLVGFGVEAHDDLMDAFVYCVQGLMSMYSGEPQMTIV